MRRTVAGLVVAAVAIAGAFLLIVKVGVGDLLQAPVAPIQNLAFERVVLEEGSIEAKIRNAGPDPIDIAQVQIDGAYWVFTQSPPGTLGKLDTAALRLDYPWVEGEPVAITVLDRFGTTFTHEIAVAAATPRPGGRTAAGYVLLGTYAGVIPVLLGLLFLPVLQRLSERGLRFLLGLTAGLLGFLALDGLEDALEVAHDVPAPFQGEALVFGGVSASLAVLVLVARALRGRRGSVSGLAVSYLIAIGIGLHNFGEGLAIGSAQAVGAIALGTFLVIGFAVHNLTEGIGIVAPSVRKPPGIAHLLALGAIAGLPTVAGTLIGGFAYSPVLAVLLLSLGIGAIVQVVWELARLVGRDRALSAPSWVFGIGAGFAIMYGTGLLVKA